MSAIFGRNGYPPCIRTTPETVQFATAQSTGFHACDSQRRSPPKGRSYRKVDAKLCLMSNVETARSALRGAPKVTAPAVLPVVSTFLSGLASDASSTECANV